MDRLLFLFVIAWQIYADFPFLWVPGVETRNLKRHKAKKPGSVSASNATKTASNNYNDGVSARPMKNPATIAANPLEPGGKPRPGKRDVRVLSREGAEDLLKKSINPTLK